MQSRSLSWFAAGVLVVAGVAVAGVHYAGAGASSAAPAASSAAEDLAALAIPAQSAPLPLVPVLRKGEPAASLTAELNIVRPLIADTNGPLDKGTATLAQWASKNLTWADLKALPSTSAALFRKDPDQERGRLLCIEGKIQEIRAEKNLARRLVSDRAAPLVEAASTSNALAQAPLGGVADATRADAGEVPRPLAAGADGADWQVPGGKVFFATIVAPDHEKTEEARLKGRPFLLEAIAVKGTGTLVDGDSARFCGILTGVVLPGSDARLEHRAVGMFDLPENVGAAPRAGTATPRPALETFGAFH